MEGRIWGPTNVTGQETLRNPVKDILKTPHHRSHTALSFLLVVRFFLPFISLAALDPTVTVCGTAGGLSHIAADPKPGDWDQLQPPYAKHRWHAGSWSLTLWKDDSLSLFSWAKTSNVGETMTRGIFKLRQVTFRYFFDILSENDDYL